MALSLSHHGDVFIFRRFFDTLGRRVESMDMSARERRISQVLVKRSVQSSELAGEGLVEEGGLELVERGELARVERFEAAGLGLQGVEADGDAALRWEGWMRHQKLGKEA